MFSDCGEMLVLKVDAGQARLALSFKAVVMLGLGICLTAAAAWGMLWAMSRGEIVLIASLLPAGGAVAAYTMTSLWVMFRRREARVDSSSRTATPAGGKAINFAGISHVEVRAESRDFYGQDVTSYILRLVPVKGDGIRLAESDNPRRLQEMGLQLAQLIGRPLRDVTED